MSPPNFPSFRPCFGRPLCCALALSAAVLATPAAATGFIDDATGDFLPTFVGAQIDELDIRYAGAFYLGGAFHLMSAYSFDNPSELPLQVTPLYVWGVDRGAGQERLVNGSPSVGAGVVFDALVVLSKNQNDEFFGSVTTFGPGGPVTTNIDADTSGVGDSIIGYVSESLLPSTGFAYADYRFNLWTRDGLGNAHIADFALDGGMFGAEDLSTPVPEPAAWALMIAGFGVAGATLRRRRGLAAL